MQNDIHLTDKQYLIALTVFFFPYALFEVRTPPLSLAISEVYDPATEQCGTEETSSGAMAVVHYACMGNRHGPSTLILRGFILTVVP